MERVCVSFLALLVDHQVANEGPKNGGDGRI